KTWSWCLVRVHFTERNKHLGHEVLAREFSVRGIIVAVNANNLKAILRVTGNVSKRPFIRIYRCARPSRNWYRSDPNGSRPGTCSAG
ncbi:hypothetical protein J6590_101000, partial [Homalodisca vitripennis]